MAYRDRHGMRGFLPVQAEDFGRRRSRSQWPKNTAGPPAPVIYVGGTKLGDP